MTEGGRGTAVVPESWTREQLSLKARLISDDAISCRCDHTLSLLPPLDRGHFCQASGSLFGGCDLTEPADGVTSAVGSYVVVDSDLRVVHEVHEDVKVNVAYVPGYLSFREAPPLLPLLDSLPAPPSCLLCDGNGTLHPRGLGFASHLGILLGERLKRAIPTVGVSKNLHCFPGLRCSLCPGVDVTANMVKGIFRSYIACWMTGGLRHVVCGVSDDSAIMILDSCGSSFMKTVGEGSNAAAAAAFDVAGGKGKPLAAPPPPAAVLYLFCDESSASSPCGAAFLKGGGGSVNPIFVSVGHNIGLRASLHVVNKLSLRRVPEPIRLADKGGREKIRKMQQEKERGPSSAV